MHWMRGILVLRKHLCEFLSVRLDLCLTRLLHPVLCRSGQSAQWRAHHRKLCKRMNRLTASPAYAALEREAKVDAMLLSHFFALVFPSNEFTIPPTPSDGNPHSDAVATFFDLLKGRIWNPHIPLCRASSTAVPQSVFQEVLGRFGNNNFVLHSHLSSFAHGVFPLASRLFNHSCAPNCAAKYIVTPTEPITMEVVALRDIGSGEEVRTLGRYKRV